MSRVYPAGQRADAEFAYHTWLTLFNNAQVGAKPIMRKEGLMESVSTRTKAYHIPIPPLSLGGDVEEKEDGNEWPSSGIEGGEIKGATKKRGPLGAHFTEDDLIEDVIGAANARAMALGRARMYFEDRMGTKAIDAAWTQLGSDNKAILAVDHPVDRVGGTGAQINLFTGPITPDNVHKMAAAFSTFRAENGDPVYGDASELELVLWHPPALRADAEKATGREIVGEAGAGVTNMAYKIARPVCLPRLTSARRWGLAVVNANRKLVLQVVHRSMQDFRLGPESDLWKQRQVMKIYCNEKTDYVIPDWRVIVGSEF